MARNTTLSAQEITEMDEMKQKDTRNKGLKLMPVRDRGWMRLSNGAIVYWHHPARETEQTADGISFIIKPKVPDNHFGIEVEGKLTIFDAEELRRYLRWSLINQS